MLQPSRLPIAAADAAAADAPRLSGQPTRLQRRGSLPRRFRFGCRSAPRCAANRSLRLINHDDGCVGSMSRECKGTVMRRWLVALGLIGLRGRDRRRFRRPTLRGSSPFVPAAPIYTRWSGFYVGGQVGYSSAGMDFAGATQPLIASPARIALENEQHPSRWPRARQGAITGVRLRRLCRLQHPMGRRRSSASSSTTTARRSSTSRRTRRSAARSRAGGNHLRRRSLNGDASLRIIDFGTCARAPALVYGNFLPYGCVGVAVGRADYRAPRVVYGHETAVVAIRSAQRRQPTASIRLHRQRVEGPARRSTAIAAAAASTSRCMPMSSCAPNTNTCSFAPIAEHRRRRVSTARARRRHQVLIRRDDADRADRSRPRLTARGAPSLCPAAGHPSPPRGAYLEG